MSHGFFSTDNDIDSDDQSKYRRNFIANMERKLKFKESIADNDSSR